MTNKEKIDRWAEYIIPTVFRAEVKLNKARPEWEERLRRLKSGESDESPTMVMEEYCRDIATIIVRFSPDYNTQDYSDHEPEDDL